MSYSLTCFLSINQDFFEASRLYAGVMDLAAIGAVQGRFAFSNDEPWMAAHQHTVCFGVRALDCPEEKIFAIDLSDHSDRFTIPVLKNCDLYFKRSYYGPDLAAISDPQLRSKVLPFGLNYVARTGASARVVSTKFLAEFISQCTRKPATTFNRFRELLGTAWRYWLTPDEKAFESPPEANLDDAVSFQTRVWPPGSASDDVEAVNEERVGLIRSLKKRFGDRFRGGLYPSAYAKSRYPDAVSPLRCRPRDYIGWQKRTLVGVYTSGLHNSITFKLPEYLAAAKCIVSVPVRNQLPVPLINGEHFTVFTGIDECVEMCARALENREHTAQMRQNAWSYYKAHVQPSAQLMNCIRLAVSQNAIDDPAIITR